MVQPVRLFQLGSVASGCRTRCAPVVPRCMQCPAEVPPTGDGEVRGRYGWLSAFALATKEGPPHWMLALKDGSTPHRYLGQLPRTLAAKAHSRWHGSDSHHQTDGRFCAGIPTNPSLAPITDRHGRICPALRSTLRAHTVTPNKCRSKQRNRREHSTSRADPAASRTLDPLRHSLPSELLPAPSVRYHPA